MDAAVHAPGQSAQQQDRQPPEQGTAAQPQPSASPEPQQAGKRTADAAPNSRTEPELHLGAAQAEVTWLQRRYGSGLQLQPPAAVDAVQGRHTAAPAAAAARQQAGQQEAANEMEQQPQPGTTQLSVSLTPTDPAWDRGPLRLRIRLGDSFPAAGSVTVLSAKSCQDDDSSGSGSGAHICSAKAAGSISDLLSAGAAEVLAKLLTAQAAADARSRSAPLRALVRSLENNAGHFVQQIRAE